MARVFSAVDIEKPEILEEIEEVRNKIDLGFNPVETHKMHITLQFFEDINQKQIETVKARMDDVSISNFEAEVKGIGAFPSKNYIRVIWAGVKGGRFQGLYNQVSDHSVDDSNDHKFKPHITLLRVKNLSRDRKKKLQRIIKEFDDHSFGTINVKRVKLFETKLKPSGSVYKQLHVKEL